MNSGNLWAVLGWLVVTGIVNWAMRTKTAEEWEVLAEKNPRYAAFARLLRSLGLDPVKLITAVVDVIKGRAAQAEAPKEEKPEQKEEEKK